MFGDASLTPEERAAKNAALKSKSNKPTQTVAVGPDLPGAFNVGGAAGAASDACARACGGHLSDVIGLRPLNVNNYGSSSSTGANGGEYKHQPRSFH